MKEEMDRLIEFLEEDEGAFLNHMIDNLTDEELSAFLRENPDFINEI